MQSSIFMCKPEFRLVVIGDPISIGSQNCRRMHALFKNELVSGKLLRDRAGTFIDINYYYCNVSCKTVVESWQKLID